MGQEQSGSPEELREIPSHTRRSTTRDTVHLLQATTVTHREKTLYVTSVMVSGRKRKRRKALKREQRKDGK